MDRRKRLCLVHIAGHITLPAEGGRDQAGARPLHVDTPRLHGYWHLLRLSPQKHRALKRSGAACGRSGAFFVQALGHGPSEFADICPKAFGQAEQCRQGRARTGKLQFGNEGAVQTALESQTLLAQAGSITPRPHFRCEGAQQDWILVRTHAPTVSGMALLCTRLYGTKHR